MAFVRINGVRHRPGGLSVVIGGAGLAVFVLAGLLAPLLAPHDPRFQALDQALLPPVPFGGGSWRYPLGTDALGRDVLSRLLYGSRISLLIGVVTVVGSGIVGVTLGIMSGFVGGRTDATIQRLVELVQSLPFLLVAIITMSLLGQGLTNLLLILIATRWIQFCRIVRADAMGLRSREYVLAARVAGVTSTRIASRHIFPNVLPSAIVVATFSLSVAIMAESGLSFLGLGVPPEVPTWGSMLAEGSGYMYRDPWLTILPGAVLFATVLAVNLMGDGLRDMLDPKLIGRV